MITTLTRSTSDQVRPAKTTRLRIASPLRGCADPDNPNGGQPATADDQHPPAFAQTILENRTRPRSPRQPQILVHQRRKDDNDNHGKIRSTIGAQSSMPAALRRSATETSVRGRPSLQRQ